MERNTFTLVPEEALQKMGQQLNKIYDLLLSKPTSDKNEEEWLNSKQVREILGISKKTWQNYRDQKRIPFSQHGRKIYVRRSDLDAYLKAHTIQARK